MLNFLNRCVFSSSDDQDSRWMISSSVACYTGGRRNSKIATLPVVAPYRRLWPQGLKNRARIPAITFPKLGYFS